MTIEALDAADRRDEANDQRRSARAAARAKTRQTPHDFKRAQRTEPPAPTPGTPEALVAAVRATAARDLDEARTREAAAAPVAVPTAAAEPFSIVDAPPPSAGPTPIPDVRRRAQAYARANPGQWIRYPSNPEDPYRRAASITSHIREGVSGFAPAGSFEHCTRQNVLYFRYLGEDGQS